MSLLVLIAACLIELFWQKISAYRNYQWLNDYHDRWLLQLNSKHMENEWIRIVAVLLPPIIVAGIFLWSEQSGAGLLIQWIAAVIVLVWSLGPAAIAEKACQLQAKGETAERRSRTLLIYGHRGYFAIVFWFIVAGPVAALSYRLIHQFLLHHRRSLDDTDPALPKFAEAWQQLFDIVDFIPARVTSFLFLLTGDFLRGISVFQSYLMNMDNDTLVTETGQHVIPTGDSDESFGCVKELLERSFMLLLVIIAVVSVFSV